VDRRLRRLGLVDVTAYRAYLDDHPDEWSQLDQLCRIPISRFYRDRGVFDLLRDDVLPSLAAAARARDQGVVRAWSAGCASGEEVYTLKIIWDLRIKPLFPALRSEIIATDADPHLLERARLGCYPSSSLKDFPPEWITIAFSKLGDEYRVRENFRSGIECLLQDIRQEQPAGPFDIILCRHLVFTYFDESLQLDILRTILSRLGPNGILVTGKQEPLHSEATCLEPYAPHSGVYRRI
jgi:chemotaxis protein methyltransferase CheR